MRYLVYVTPIVDGGSCVGLVCDNNFDVTILTRFIILCIACLTKAPCPFVAKSSGITKVTGSGNSSLQTVTGYRRDFNTRTPCMFPVLFKKFQSDRPIHLTQHPITCHGFIPVASQASQTTRGETEYTVGLLYCTRDDTVSCL